MEEKNIEKIVIHYDNGEENTIHKGFMCGIKEDTESGEAIDAALSVPEFSAGMTEQEKEEYKENVIRKIHENI